MGIRESAPKAPEGRHNIAWGASPRTANLDTLSFFSPRRCPQVRVQPALGGSAGYGIRSAVNVISSWGSRPRLYYAAPVRGLSGLLTSSAPGAHAPGYIMPPPFGG